MRRPRALAGRARAHRARHAQHAGADRRGHHRPVRRRRRSTQPSARRAETRARAPSGSTVWVERRGADSTR
ncbi:MAG: hypothetical protein MZW92_63955 [Comamonadaceae bacterium]|nr:hypothetical protein [Comamonadaceae bacterium]